MSGITQLATQVLGQLRQLGTQNHATQLDTLSRASATLTAAAPVHVEFSRTLSQAGQALHQAHSLLDANPAQARSSIATARFALDLLIPG